MANTGAKYVASMLFNVYVQNLHRQSYFALYCERLHFISFANSDLRRNLVNT